MNGRIRALHAEEVEGFFKRIGFYDELMGGDIRCRRCERTITPENFRGVRRRGRYLRFFCSARECIVSDPFEDERLREEA